MITRNGKLTAWTDSLENLLLAAHDAAFGQHKNEVNELVSERYGVTVTVEAGSASTESKELTDIALAQGYWIKAGGFGSWEIMLNWTQDPNKPPDSHAIHAVMSELGSRTSEAKAAAARQNGKKGGRPRKPTE